MCVCVLEVGGGNTGARSRIKYHYMFYNVLSVLSVHYDFSIKIQLSCLPFGGATFCFYGHDMAIFRYKNKC